MCVPPLSILLTNLRKLAQSCIGRQRVQCTQTISLSLSGWTAVSRFTQLREAGETLYGTPNCTRLFIDRQARYLVELILAADQLQRRLFSAPLLGPRITLAGQGERGWKALEIYLQYLRRLRTGQGLQSARAIGSRLEL